MFKYLCKHSLSKFILVGIVNTIVGYSIIFLFYNAIKFDYWISSAIAYIFVSVLSFTLNKYFTFRVREWSVFMVLIYIVNIAVCYFIAYGIARPAMNLFFGDRDINIRENIALFTGMCLFVGLNYIGQRFIVFKQEKNHEKL